jgi:hypothetical protein
MSLVRPPEGTYSKRDAERSSGPQHRDAPGNRNQPSEERTVASNGGSVIRYEGARGTTWRIKFRDATGRQVMESVGREADGWTERKAQRALGARLAEVEQTRWRKPGKTTFEVFAERFQTEVLPGRNLKPSTVIDYKTTLRLHLVPAFAGMEIGTIEAAVLDRYIASKTGTSRPRPSATTSRCSTACSRSPSAGASSRTTPWRMSTGPAQTRPR